jgi:hypothetical protein
MIAGEKKNKATAKKLKRKEASGNGCLFYLHANNLRANASHNQSPAGLMQ